MFVPNFTAIQQIIVKFICLEKYQLCSLVSRKTGQDHPENILLEPNECLQQTI